MNENTIIQGDALEVLKTLPAESVDCCITSPPYFGLRDYGTASWEGGDENCDHLGKPHSTQAGFNERYTGKSPVETDKQGALREPFKNICGKCGAKRIDRQIGLEETPEAYVQKLVDLFHEVKRVLKDDGTLWLNLGDSYWGGKGKSGSGNPEEQAERVDKGESINQSYHQVAGDGLTRPQDGKHEVIKPKDLVGIPWRVAFALQADGWYLRQDIIWAKPNPMPESVTDRCTKSHEYIFLLSKAPKYYFDNEAIKEEAVWDVDGEGTIARKERQHEGLKSNPDEWKNGIRHKNLQEKGQTPHTMHKLGVTYPNGKHKDGQQSPKFINGFRNKRSVWTITTKGFSEAHFATFPEDLIAPMVLAGCPKDGVVLDSFFGAGTTGLVAKKLRRNYLGIELNPEYIKIAEARIRRANVML